LLDRFDILLEVPRQKIDKILSKEQQETSQQVRQKVVKAWERQKARFKNEKINFNSQMDTKLIDKYCPLSDELRQVLKQAAENLSLSARAIHRVIKLARTLADLDDSENIEKQHILEALQYRSKSMFVEE
jgi:magnesium chelatase family protein